MAVFVAFPIARGYVEGAKQLFTLFLIAVFLPPALIPHFQLMLRLGLYNNPVGYIMLFLANPIGIIILVNYIKTLPTKWMKRQPWVVAAVSVSLRGSFSRLRCQLSPLLRFCTPSASGMS
jgi:hypothetical protein